MIVNTSLSCADFTLELKRAFVTPLIKKLILDCEIFKNYRPVSNLSFVSKLNGRIVCVQLVENDLYEIFQFQDRTQTVQIGSSTSEPVTLKYGFHKDQYLDLFYLPCTPLHFLVISSVIIVWISTFMLMIRKFMYHLSHVIQYLDRPPYHRLRSASRTSKHGWPTTC